MTALSDALKNPTNPELWKKVCEELKPDNPDDIFRCVSIFNKFRLLIPRNLKGVLNGFSKYVNEEEAQDRNIIQRGERGTMSHYVKIMVIVDKLRKCGVPEDALKPVIEHAESKKAEVSNER